MTLYIHEMKMNIKSLIIWTVCVGGLCFGCILLYTSLEEQIKDIADVYSNMGAMSKAMGMDKMSLATLAGFYATEIAMMHGLGGAMFAAILGITMLSKEEAGHTSEFLNVFPIDRKHVVMGKYMALVSNLVIFNLVCALMYVGGFVIMDEDVPVKEMVLYHLAQLLMQLEIGTICFLISALSRRNRLGAGLGITILLFAADMMCRILPAIEDLKYITPFYYSNAPDIFTAGEVDGMMVIIGGVVVFGCIVGALVCYDRRDLAS